MSYTSDIVNLVLPYPPSVNTYYRNVNGRMIICQSGRDYKQAVYYNVNYHIGTSRIIFPAERLRLVINLYPPDKRKRDIDNTVKAVQDALAGAKVYADDCQIDQLIVNRNEVVKGGKCIVEITPIK